MRFVEAAHLDPNPQLYVLSGCTASRLGGFHLMALVYFPSSAAFTNAWSDPELVTNAFPLREPMIRAGFEHVWLRCEAEEPRFGGCGHPPRAK